MTRASRTGLLALWTLTLWSILLPSAQAYVDPGSTSVIFQAIVAFIAAAGTGIAMFRTKIRMFFQRNKPSQGDGSVDG